MSIIRTAPNGTQVRFPDGTSEETINQYLNLPKYSVETTTVKETNTPVTPSSNTERSIVADIGTQAVGGVFDAVNSGVGLVEKLGDTLGEWTNIGGFVFGDDAENGVMQYKSYDELKADGNSDLLFGKVNEKDAGQLPEIDDPDTIAGSITRGITQFTTGYLFGGRILGAFQPVSTAGTIAKTMGAGAIADFTAFDEETGRLVDIVNQVAPKLQNPLFDYLSSDPEDTWYEARFKNALEGSLVGGALEATFRTFRLIKNKIAQKNGQQYDEKLIKEDEEFLRNNTSSPDAGTNTGAKDIKEIKTTTEEKKLVEKTLENIDKKLEDKVYEQFKAQQAISKNKDEFDVGVFDLDLSLNFNLREFEQLDEGGLLSLDAFEKAYENVFKNNNKILTDEQVFNSAKRLYENNAGRLEIEIKDFEQLLRKAPMRVVAMNSYIETLSNGMKRLAGMSKTDPKAKEYIKRIFIPKFKTIIEQKKSISSNLGRTLRVNAKTPPKSIQQEIGTAIKEMEMYDGNIDDFINKLAKIENVDLSKVFSYVTKNQSWNVVNEVWINALLSNPKTHIINISSNIANTILKPIEHYIGSKLILPTSKEAKKLRAESIRAVKTFVGFREYLSDAIKYMNLAFKNEDTIIGGRQFGAGKLDTPVKSVGGILGKITRLPTRFLNGADEFFKQINYRSRLKANAIMEAIENGLDTKTIVGSSLNKKPISEFDAYVLERIAKGYDEGGLIGIDKDAMRYAQESTFTQDLTGIFEKMQNIINEYPILRQVVPFVKTPVNLMLNVVDRTPLGFIRKEVRDNFLGRNGAEKMAQARGQLAVGTGLITYASILYKEGYITGMQGTTVDEKTTNSKDLKELKKSTGALPYAFKYWDKESQTHKYIQFGRFDPFGAFFGMVADFNDFYSKLTEEEAHRVGGDMLLLLTRQGGDIGSYIDTTTKIQNVVQAGASSISRNLFSKTYLKGLADFMEIITTDEPNKLNRYINSKLGSFIPNIYTKLINDPFYRDVRSILDEVKKRTGAEEVEYKYDFRGNPLKVQGDETDRFINGMFNPFAYSEDTQDPVAQEILSLGVNIPKMNEKFQGDIDLNLFVNSKGQTGYNRLQEILRDSKIGGKDLNTALLDLINSSKYKKLSEPIVVDDLNKDDGGKVQAIKTLVKRYQNYAETLLMKESKAFFSSKDKRGKFTLMDSLKNSQKNKSKLNMGIIINNDDLKSLYQFTNDL